MSVDPKDPPTSHLSKPNSEKTDQHSHISRFLHNRSEIERGKYISKVHDLAKCTMLGDKLEPSYLKAVENHFSIRQHKHSKCGTKIDISTLSFIISFRRLQRLTSQVNIPGFSFSVKSCVAIAYGCSAKGLAKDDSAADCICVRGRSIAYGL